MEKKDLPKLPKNWKELGYKKIESKEDKEKIQPEINCVYQTHVKDLVKVIKIYDETQTVLLQNISGAFSQRVDIKNLNLVKKIH